VKPARRDVAREVSLPCELWAWQRVAIVAKVTGYVGRVPVDRGSRVAAGDLLATISVPELEDEKRKRLADIKVAEAEIESAVANAELQSVTAKRFAALVAEHAVSVQERDEAKARELVAQARVVEERAKLAAAREQLTATETWLAYGTIAAPFTGTVMERWVHPGALVSQAERTPLFEIVDASTIRCIVDVPEADAPRVKAGATAVRVAIPELAGARAGLVVRSASALDPKTRTLRIEVDLANEKGDLIPGMFGQVALVMEKHADVWVLPSAAVARGESDAAVFVVSGGKARRVPVKLGLDDGSFVEVKEGIEPEETLAAVARGLSDGAVVQIKEEKR
jgi:RND family efflux transporter MFP subunit